MRVLSRISIPQGDLNKFTEEYKQELILKYKDSFESLSWEDGIGYIEIYRDNNEYSNFIEQLNGDNIYFTQQFKSKYSKKELDESKLLVIKLKYQCEMTYNGQYNKYFGEDYIGCKSYTRQHSDLEILKRDLGKKDILISIENEYIVSPRLKNILDKENLTGLKYRPVYTKKDAELVAYQMIIENRFAPLHQKTTLKVVNNDKICSFNTFIRKREDPLFYSNESIGDAKDFNITSEYFGIGVFPRPVRIVSQRVRQVFLKNRIRGVEFEPVFILD